MAHRHVMGSGFGMVAGESRPDGKHGAQLTSDLSFHAVDNDDPPLSSPRMLPWRFRFLFRWLAIITVRRVPTWGVLTLPPVSRLMLRRSTINPVLVYGQVPQAEDLAFLEGMLDLHHARVILLGVRKGLDMPQHQLLAPAARPVTVKQAIDDLPRIRSRLSRGDSVEAWRKAVQAAPSYVKGWRAENESINAGTSQQSAVQAPPAALNIVQMLPKLRGQPLRRLPSPRAPKIVSLRRATSVHYA